MQYRRPIMKPPSSALSVVPHNFPLAWDSPLPLLVQGWWLERCKHKQDAPLPRLAGWLHTAHCARHCWHSKAASAATNILRHACPSLNPPLMVALGYNANIPVNLLPLRRPTAQGISNANPTIWVRPWWPCLDICSPHPRHPPAIMSPSGRLISCRRQQGDQWCVVGQARVVATTQSEDSPTFLTLTNQRSLALRGNHSHRRWTHSHASRPQLLTHKCLEYWETSWDGSCAAN